MSTTIGISLHQKPYDYVRKCVESALSQTAEVKVILRTEGPDACDEQTLDYLKKLDIEEEKFKLIIGNKKLGIYPSYNEIFDSVDTDNICQLDADDYLEPEAIEICEKTLSENPHYSMVYTDCMEVDESGNSIGLHKNQQIEYSASNLLINFITYHLRVIRTRVFESVGKFDESLPFSADYDICLKISEIGLAENVGYIPLPLYNYRISSDSMFKVNFDQTNLEAQIASQKALMRRGLSDEYKTLLNRRTGNLLIHPVLKDNNLDFSDSQPIIFTGMHRSCTSLISNMLTKLGIDMGESVLEPDEFNPKGYFENKNFLFFDTYFCDCASKDGEGFPNWGWTRGEDLDEKVLEDFKEPAKYVINLHLDKKLWGWKDPRTSLLLKFWEPLLPTAKYIFAYRNPNDVINSVKKLNISVFKENSEYIEECWISHNKNILEFYKNNQDRCLLLSTDQLLKNPSLLKVLIENKFNLELEDYDLNSLITEDYLHSTEEVLTTSMSEELFEELNKNADLPYVGLLGP